MIYSNFHEEVFKDKVWKALTSVRRVLDVNRAPNVRLAENVDHDYIDKYKLADLLTNTTIVAFMAVFERLGLTKEVLRSIGDTSKDTTLRFSTSESCTFVKEEVVDEPLPFAKETKEATTVATEFGTEESTTHKSTIERIVTRVTRQHYKIETDWELSIYSGTDVGNRKVIKERRGATSEFVRSRANKKGTSKERPPFPPKKDLPPKELSLTWLLQQIDAEELKSHFAIDTSPDNAKTKTPSRNLQVEEAASFFRSVQDWTRATTTQRLANIYRKYNIYDLDRLTADSIFVPVIPLLVDQNLRGEGLIGNEAESWVESEAIDSNSKTMVSLPTTDTINNCEGDSLTLPSPMLLVGDTTSFLNEQARTLSEMQRKLEEEFADLEMTNKLVTSVEAMMYVLFLHIDQLICRFDDSIQYIELMLQKQLVSAIGKQVNNTDLNKYMRYHNEKTLNPSPKPFCYTIRRPEHYPDGILRIEQVVEHDNTETVESISTHVRELASVDPIKVPLNAATTLELTGKTYLHGWLNHRFGYTPSGSIRLNARARQFSSFVLLIGTMTSQNGMQPKDAIVLRNRDEIHIPLLLNEIPTATEFKDAIGSLSPEQQRFAKSFRSMQLESSVLGVCVIQIKPQLEKLLGLPQNSLTKEMKLTEDLTELFIEYQVPSDLVSCDYGAMADIDNQSKSDNYKSVKDQVANVREHVKSVLDVIAAQKKEQLKAQEMKTDMALEQKLSRPHESPFGIDDYFCAVPSTSPVLMRSKCSARAKPREVARGGLAGPSSNRDGCCVSSAPPPGPGGGDKGSRYSATEISPNAAKSNFKDAEISPLETDVVVYASIPKILDRAIELHDRNAALRSTTIETANSDWTRIRQKNLLSKAVTGCLTKCDIASEKSRAFDLLDALSRSGSLEIPFSELHVVICATHRFEKNVMETVIQDNINPIEKLEMSTLLMASIILDIPARDLIRSEKERERLEMSFPLLLDAASSYDALTTSDDDGNIPVDS